MKKYFKVKYGFGTLDKVSVDEKELEKAIYAQITGTPIQLGNSFINGRNIISITPDYHRYTGWYESYEPQSGEDWIQIKRDCPDFEGSIEHYKKRVSFLIQINKVKEIGQNILIPEIDEVYKGLIENK